MTRKSLRMNRLVVASSAMGAMSLVVAGTAWPSGAVGSVGAVDAGGAPSRADASNAGGAAKAICEPLELAPMLEALGTPRIESDVLPNGLRVVLAPRPGARTVAVRVAYDVGSRDEPESLGGLAHFVEHLMFKGSERVADGEHFRRVRDVGGRVNAFTDWDLTEYVDTLPSAALARVLESEADRMRGLRLDAASLETQRAAIQEEEALRVLNVPYAEAASSFLGQIWKSTPYDHSPMGTDVERQAARLADVEAFHAEHYAPDNAVVVLVGGFEPSAAMAAIAEAFGSIPGGKPRTQRPAGELAAFDDLGERAPEHASKVDPLAPFPVYGLIWPGVGVTDPEAPALAVLDELLLGHRDARLSRVVRGPLAFEATSLSFALRDAGLLNFVIVPRTFASFREIRRTVDTVLAELAETGPDPDELCAAIRREQIERLVALETNEGLSAALARGVLFEQDPRRFARELAALAALSVGDLREAAERMRARSPSTLVIRPEGLMGWLKPLLEILPDGVGASLERSLL
jgi:zinc protease